MKSGSMRDLDALVSKRLASSWGRCQTKVKTHNELQKLLRDIQDDVPSNRRLDTSIITGNNHSSYERMMKWKRVAERAGEAPEEVVMLDRRGRTCLATACTKDPPVFVLEALLDACKFGMEAQTDKTGHTALHIAILHKASPDVILSLSHRRRILDVADHRGNTALHLLCQSKYRHPSSVDVLPHLVQVLASRAPNLVDRENFTGKTCLHVAIESGASLDILHSLIDGCPSVLTRDACGNSALILAILNDTHFSVLQRICQLEPSILTKRDQFGRLPLRCALDHRVWELDRLSLLANSREAVLEQDSMGRNALHMVLDRTNVQAALVDLLLDVCPESIFMITKYGETPVQAAYRRYAQSINSWQYRGATSASLQRTVRNWWQVVNSMLRRLAQGGESVLAAALRCKPCNCPLLVIQRLIEEDRDISRNRSPLNGLYPIMVAARLRDHPQKSEILLFLLKEAPEIARIPDNEGRSVLVWVSSCGQSSASVTEALVQSHPECVILRDPVHGLLPFQVAALGRDEKDSSDSKNKSASISSSAPEQRERYHAQWTSNIFTLLQAAPYLVKP